MTEIQTRFNPFSPTARSARLFLSRIPPNARANGLVINTDLLPKSSKESPSLYVKFSTFRSLAGFTFTFTSTCKPPARGTPLDRR